MAHTAVSDRVKITGICTAARGAVAAELARTQGAAVWLAICDDLKAAEQLAEDTGFFLKAAAGAVTGAAAVAGGADPGSPAFDITPAGGSPPGHSGQPTQIVVFPESQADSRDMREAFAASSDRLNVLSKLKDPHRPSLFIATTPAALLQSVPAREAFTARELALRRGQTQPFARLLEQLQELDYDSEAVCESPGSYAVRGGIIDVYPVTATQPYRLDFFGDELEDIRGFDPVTQRSGESVSEIRLPASPRVRLEAARAGLADYLPDNTHLLLVEPSALEEEFGALGDNEGGGFPALLARCARVWGVSDLDEASPWFDGEIAETTWDTESLVHHRRYPEEGLLAQDRLQAEESGRRDFLGQLSNWQRNGYELLFVAAKEGEEQRMREILTDDNRFKGTKLNFLRAGNNEGFRWSSAVAGGADPGNGDIESGTARGADSGRQARQARPSLPGGLSWLPASAAGLVVITETEIFGRQRPRRAAGGAARAVVQRAQVDQLLDFSELVEGDFVVHLQHGIALFRGLTRLDTAVGIKEVISLEFDEGVTLHVPLTESHLVSRYVGLSKARPQLGRIGTGRWEKARQAAERSTLDLAAELLQLQARREAQPGHAFPADNEWQREFEGSFPFTETRDQLKAIQETKSDLERTRPMDRLICGDVGFGKTEVAIRAAFKAVQGGRQVAVLVPTTILAQQHLNTFRERMAGYPIAVEMLSRFRAPKEQKQILAAVKLGQIDILIGTHRLIQSDVAFQELGLVVIDEEQRFGVKHKEAFKRMRETVDVLSMSATPIPRTLYLALTGARDLSVIETAPINRHPIQTIVKTYDEKVVVDAVRYEIRRGGQVFYLHNRVDTIQLVASRLAQLLPDISIGVGHGQMEAAALERVMTDFVAGRYQVLVCTTIIESGLDIPNCNTIVIEGADRFGLSQLYQLRGRVGRFKHQAYAYLLLHRHTRLLDIARQRLAALRQHNQLGAGFRIAMRDLELRGAGNLLGPEQSGHIVGVGFELYCQLLRQSVARLKGEKTAAFVRASVKLDFVFLGEAVTGDNAGRQQTGYTAIKDAEDDASSLPPVGPIQARLPGAYIAETRLRIDFYRRLALADQPGALKDIEAELKDRFGKFGDEVRALLLVTEIRIRAEQKGLLSVETELHRLKCLRNSGRRDDFVMIGSRFPRLTAPKPLLRLREIIAFLNNLPNP
ncbi:MAG TPA: transcription-repair coupling factor [Opitutaceae bacterium]|jgi:transcription-repair coupling factor (superfamily II helicase)